MNRQQAPEIKPINSIHTGFPAAQGSLFRIRSEEEVFKLEIVYPNAGYGLCDNKFHALYGMDLLLSGTSELSASQISEALDSLGSYVFKNCDYYTASITLYGLTDNLINTLDIVKTSVENCLYSENELNVYKNRKVSELNININKTNFLANRAINELIFGDTHPYAQKSTEESIHAVKSEDLKRFKSKYLVNPYFIFTGPSSIDISAILKNQGFELTNAITKSAGEQLAKSKGLEEKILKPGSTQNSIRFGKILPARSHPDYYKLSLLNLVLGGYFGSRLMKNIREEKGLTYGIHSSISPFKNFSLFKISSECNNTLTQTVKEEIEKEIIQLQNELVPEEELTIARNYMLGSLLRNFDGAFNISERLKAYLELETEEGYYERYFEAINKISAEELKATANNYLDIKTLSYCVAGEV